MFGQRKLTDSSLAAFAFGATPPKLHFEMSLRSACRGCVGARAVKSPSSDWRRSRNNEFCLQCSARGFIKLPSVVAGRRELMRRNRPAAAVASPVQPHNLRLRLHRAEGVGASTPIRPSRSHPR